MEGQQQKIQLEGGSLFQGSSARKMTDKGFHWKLENLAKDFSATITQWRKQANEIQVLLSDSKNTQEIRTDQKMLMDIMSRLEATYSTIDAHFTDRNGKAADGTRTLEEFQGKYDGIANDHHTVLRNITSCLQDLEFDSASRNSSRTLRSRSSRTSRSSYLSRTSRKSTEVMVEASALKAKLKYIDVEAKHKADLERIRTQRPIDVAQAKLDVLESTQDSNLNMEELLSEVDTDRQVREFLGAEPDMTKPVSEHTDDPSTAVAYLRVVELTSCMAGHTPKEIEIGQDPVISPKTGKLLSRSEIENQEQMKSFRMILVCVQDPYFLEHNTSTNVTEKIKTDFIRELSVAQEKLSQIQTDGNPRGLTHLLITEESPPSEQTKPGKQKSHSLNLPYSFNLPVNVGHLSREMEKFVEKSHSTHIFWCKTLCFFRRVVLKEVLLIKCCIEKESLGLKEQLKTTESAVQNETGTCKKIFSSDIDVVKSEEVVENEKAMENVEAMSVMANANGTEINNSPLKNPAQIL